MPIDYGNNNVTTSGNIIAATGNFTGLSINNIPVSLNGHSHGNITSDGKIGSVADRIITTADSGLLVANSDVQFNCSAVFIGTSGDFINNGGIVLTPQAIIFSDNTVQETAYTGKIGSTSGLLVVTTTDGSLTSSSGVNSSLISNFNSSVSGLVSGIYAPISHLHGNITNAGAIGSTANLPLITTTAGAVTTGSFGSTANTFCQGNDSRLSDSRTPLSHTHGSITNAGAIGSTANLPLITTTAGAITTGSFGSSVNTFCQGNDSRLSDSRTPLGHTHGNITNAGAIGATANLPLITTTAGAITVGSFGNTANSFCQGNDSRLSDTRTPTDGTVTTAKIVDANVTYAKIQNVSATDRLLGRSTAGAGVVQEIACTAFGRSLIDDADSATARTTLGLGTMATAAAANYLALAGGTLTGAIQVTAGTAAAPGISISGDTNTGIAQLGGADSFSVIASGVERLRVASDGAQSSVVPGGSTLYPEFKCRAWVNFNGVGTVTIRTAGNVTSITDNGTGDYTVNFTTAMPDSNFCVLGTWGTGANTTSVPTVVRPGAVTTSSVRISVNYVVSGTTVISDGEVIYVAIIR